MKIYIAGPMRGIPEFNFPAFHAAATRLRKEGNEVFSPAERDLEKYGTDFSAGNEAGSEEQAAVTHGFSIREAMSVDAKWICEQADAIVLLPGWENSKGAKAEKALAEAIGLKVIELGEEDR